MVRPGAVVVLAPPGGGEGVLVAALSRAAGVALPRAETPPFPEAVDGLRAADAIGEPRRRGRHPGPATHRLVASDLRRGVRRDAERALAASLDGPGRPLLSGLRLALRVPFLDAVLPDARFVLVRRDLETALAIALDGWRGGQVVSAPGLDGWDGAPWSLPLIPGWPALSGLPLGEVVGRQWAAICSTALDDLDELDPGRWCVADRTALLEDPRTELRRIADFLGLAYDQAMLTPVEAARRSTARRASVAPTPELAAALAVAEPADARLRGVMAEHASGPPAVTSAADPATALASRSSPSFARVLGELGVTALLTADPAGALVVVRERGAVPNTHFHGLSEPGAVAALDGRVAVAVRDEIVELREEGTAHVPRVRHLVGPIGVQDLAYDDDATLWVASAALNGVARVDARDGVSARWRPDGAPTGIAVRGSAPTHATILVRKDPTGGALVDLGSGDVVADGLSHPRAPRWHDGRLFLLEAGRGALVVADPVARDGVEVVAELPGYARALAIAGQKAFVGLSQLREPGAAAGLPVTGRVGERRSGVWIVDLRRGTIDGFLRFADLVQEVHGLALVSRRRARLAS